MIFTGSEMVALDGVDGPRVVSAILDEDAIALFVHDPGETPPDPSFPVSLVD